MALAVGRRLGLDSDELFQVARAAELHDVGKVAMPDAILQKPGPLTDVEWSFMRQHTIAGDRILSAAPALEPVAKLVRASHEHYDGNGYPDRLAGDDIPLGSRIVAVCDAFHAMTTDRPYRSAVPMTQAIAELRRCAGMQFDPDVVRAFCDVVDPSTDDDAPQPDAYLRVVDPLEAA
jgi:HD-GYP domain-containing protein (c-di-GMP phosphodiesterase class II)